MSTTKLFPIGTMSSSESIGTIDSIEYSMFEPNGSCSSSKQFNVLTTQFLSQTISTRKMSDPVLTINYKYEDIFSKEFRQLEHFMSDNDDALYSFLVVDWSKGFTPDNISETGNDWIISTLNTSNFSIYNGYKASRVFVWYGKKRRYRVGNIVSLSTHTSFTVDLDANEYGDLTFADARSYGTIFPLYECFPSANALSNFKTTNFIHSYDINASACGGYMYTGEINFTSKYKV